MSLSGSISPRSVKTEVRSRGSGALLLPNQSPTVSVIPHPESDTLSRRATTRTRQSIAREAFAMILLRLRGAVETEHRRDALLGALRHLRILRDLRPQLAGQLEVALARRHQRLQPAHAQPERAARGAARRPPRRPQPRAPRRPARMCRTGPTIP